MYFKKLKKKKCVEVNGIFPQAESQNGWWCRTPEGCFISKSFGVTEDPQDRILDALTDKKCSNTHVLFHKKFSFVTMTTYCYRELEEERVHFYAKVKNVVYFHEFEVTRELTKVAAASVVYFIKHCYHSKLAHNSQQISAQHYLTDHILFAAKSFYLFWCCFFLKRNGTLDDALLADIFISQGHELPGCKWRESLL